MHEFHIDINFSARFYQLGNLSKETQHVIFAIHGYGQQAKYFLNKFKPLDDGNTCIIAPEGLSRFYLEGFKGRVGATWMTKEDRKTDIKNYLSFLNSLYESTSKQISSSTKVTLLGFSQGSATVSRWAADGYVKFDELVLWAGIFPPDMNTDIASEIFKTKKVIYVYGDKDPYINSNKLIEMKNLSNDLNVTPEIVVFKGEHVIDPIILSDLFINNG